MLCNEPTKFYIPNIAVPLTDGDIAFMLLTDINCDGEYEKKLFPSFVTEKEGYSARYLFDYLHASDSNCIYVAQKLLEHYVEDKDGNLSFDIEYLSCKKFEDLYRTFESAKPLIENEADKKKLSDVIELVKRLSKTEKIDSEISWAYDAYTDGEAKLSIRDGHGGPFKGVGSHSVNTVFYLDISDSYINFFLTGDDFDLVVDIGGGGDRKGPMYTPQGGDEVLDFEPNRFYEISIKSKLVKVRDFYWY